MAPDLDLETATALRSATAQDLVTVLRLALHSAIRMGLVAAKRQAESDQGRVQDW